MARCSSTGKFESESLGDPEVQSYEVQDGVLTAQVRLVKECDGCGGEAKELEIEVEVDLGQLHECPGPEESEAGKAWAEYRNALEKYQADRAVWSSEEPIGDDFEVGVGGSKAYADAIHAWELREPSEPIEPDQDEPDGDEGFEVDDEPEAEGQEDTITTYRRGKKAGQRIPNSRYWTNQYGAVIRGSAKCLVCGEEFEFESDPVMEDASAFEDLNH